MGNVWLPDSAPAALRELAEQHSEAERLRGQALVLQQAAEVCDARWRAPDDTAVLLHIAVQQMEKEWSYNTSSKLAREAVYEAVDGLRTAVYLTARNALLARATAIEAQAAALQGAVLAAVAALPAPRKEKADG